MADANDMELMRQYAEDHSDDAFAELVHRHINLVYSVALRWVNSPADAQDVTQAVFVILNKKIPALRQRTTLAGWLYETTRLTARQFLRTRYRQQSREQEAYMQSISQPPAEDVVWKQVAPILEDAMTRLSEKERTLLALRFFENKTIAETAALLGIDEWAARKRASRAVEKLQKFFSRRGVHSTTEAITGAISTHSIQAVAPELVTIVTAAAMAKGASASASILTLTKGTLKIMFWKSLQTAVVAGSVVVLAAGTVTVVETSRSHPTDRPLSAEDAFLADDKRLFSGAELEKAPAALFVHPTHLPEKNGAGDWLYLDNTNEIRGAGRNQPITDALQFAYGFKPTRMVLPPDLPTNHFDCMATLPHCPRISFQNEIEQSVGLRAHAEKLTTNVLLLVVRNTNAPGLKPGGSRLRSLSWSENFYVATNYTISDLDAHLERHVFEAPVVDETGLTNLCSMRLEWHDKAELKQALLDQLGLELVLTNMPIKMLVVEKVK